MVLSQKFKELSVLVYDYLRAFSGMEETSLTSVLLAELKRFSNENMLVIKGQKEYVKGADIEWWVLHKQPDSVQALHLRIQAKKQTSPSEYGKLDYKSQIDDLLREASIDKAIPFYCFYNFHFTGAAEDEGWKYADAYDIESTRPAGGYISTNYSVINAFTTKMWELASSVENYPGKILTDFTNKHSSKIGPPNEYCHEVLPEYLFDALENYEYPNHPFLKHNEDWFKSVSRRRKANKAKLNTTLGVISTLIVLTIAYLPFIIRWVRKKFFRTNRNIIITFTKEPIVYRQFRS